MTGLCVYFGWLPSRAEREDWATLWELQHRIKEEQKEQEFRSWRTQVRSKWRN